MKILFDIGHPADVHYFKNLIFHLRERENQIIVLARDKDVTLELLNAYQISYINKGKGGVAYIDRLKYIQKSCRLIDKTIREFSPELCISHASPYLAVVARYHKIRHIMFNDTERAILFKRVVKYCKPDVYSPEAFLQKKIKGLNLLPSYKELAYLHPDVYRPQKSDHILEKLGDHYILLRFVANKATHDIYTTQMNMAYKKELVDTLSRYGNVWISSESQLPDDLNQYIVETDPSYIHDVINNASLLVGDSATMSSEAAMLGVPSIFINQNRLGYINELEQNYGLVQQFMSDEAGCKKALETAIAILEDENSEKKFLQRRDKMLSEKENMTDLMISIVEKTATEAGLIQKQTETAS